MISADRPRLTVAPLMMALILAAMDGSCPAADERRPNVVIVLVDDMGWADLGCFGGQGVATENIDRLAKEGVRFARFYVNSPLCSPSRVAITTGQYPQRWRISSYLDNRATNERRGMAQWLDPKAPVLARQLRHIGYATGHFGKWHMGGQRDVGDAPLIEAYGFDRSLTNFEGLGPRVLPLCDAHDGKPPKRHDLGSASLGTGPITWEDRSKVTSAYVAKAIEFIGEARKSGQPFYLNLWPDDVHSPFFPPGESRPAGKRDAYLAVLGAMDRQLGALFDCIRADEKLRLNTLICFASDNGPEPGAGTSLPLRGSKGLLYEGGIRSSLIVWGPGLIASEAVGTMNTATVLSAIDLNRALYAITGAPLPEGARLDGEDVSTVLVGGKGQGRRASLFWRRPPDRGGPTASPNPDLALLDGRWKFYMSYDGKTRELYDIESDGSEEHNVAGAHAETVERFANAVRDWNNSLPRDAADNPR